MHFVDESCRAFAIDENLSVEQLRSIVVEKIGLVEDGCFALFEKRDDWGMIFAGECLRALLPLMPLHDLV